MALLNLSTQNVRLYLAGLKNLWSLALAGQAGKVVTVNGTEDGYILSAAASGGGGISTASITLAYGEAEAEATVTDATVTATSKINVGWGNTTNLDENDPSMDSVRFRAIPGTGNFVVRVFADTAVGGVYKLNYQVAA